MVGNSCKLSIDCAAALRSVAQTAAGKQALGRHMVGLVEALQPAHDLGAAQLALETFCSVVISGDMGKIAAVLQYVAAVLHAVEQGLTGTSTSKDTQAKTRQQYVLLVQHLFKVPDGTAFFCGFDPQVLAEMLIQLQFQFESGAQPADREAAGSCIESLAAAEELMDGLWKAGHWQLHK
jgi:hypothetical protein